MGFDASKLIEGLGKARSAKLAAARRALDQFGEHVVGDAQQLTPVKTGFLQGSATTTPATAESETIAKQIGFNAEYAAAVHERPAKHLVGEDKYLAKAMSANASKMAPFVGDAVKAVEG